MATRCSPSTVRRQGRRSNIVRTLNDSAVREYRFADTNGTTPRALTLGDV